ncbi:Outer membrane autotransporter barrel [Pseudomonas savastanoi pv. glycinea]|nr:Outer membrane autotransporter barrel [Pseudomonas savastanoi pv. glycinea]
MEISNAGTISGGSGGSGGGFGGISGGNGISGSDLDITNAGTISGGSNSFNGANGAAIQFTGGTNSLTLQSGSVINGAIQLQGSSAATITAENDSTLGGDIQLNTNALTLDGSSDLTLSGTVSGTTGSLTKNGSGTLTLSGSNTYEGGTTLNAGALIVGSDTALATGALIAAGGTTLDSSQDVTLSNAISLGGDLTIAGSNDLTLSGTVSGTTGSLTKDGSGTLTVSGSNTYGGGTTLNAGTLIVASDAALGTGALIAEDGTTLDSSTDVTLDNATTLNGNLAIAGSNDLTLKGDVDGAGGLVKNGIGDLILSGNNVYSGGTVLNAGTLTLGSSSALGSGPVTVANGTTLNMNGYNLDIGALSGGGTLNLSNATLSLDNNVDSTFSGDLTGSVGSSLTKSGTNKLVLEGSNNVVSNTRVTAGSLIVGSSAGSLANLTGSVEVDNGALLGGHGQITGDVNVLNGATLAPGNSIGTLTINGNTTFDGGSILEIETNPDGSADRLIVNGNLDLGGSTLKVLAGAGVWSPSTSYTIVTSSNPISGTFANVTSNLAFLTPTLDYSLGTSVALTLARNDVSFAQVAATPNQRSVATVLGGNAGGTLAVAVTGLSAAQARAAYDGLSGELHASARGALFDDSRQVRESIIEQLRSGQAGNVLHHDADSGLTFWLKSYGNWSDKDGNRNVADLDRDSRGTLFGLDLPLDETWRLGFAAGYGSSDLSIGARDSSADIASTSLAVYLGGQWDALNLRLGVAHTWNEVDSKRQVRIGALRETLKTDYEANTTQVFGELGYTLHFGMLTMEPFAGLAHVEVDSDSFREHGGNAALSGKGEREQVDYASLGLHAGAPLGEVAGLPLDLRAGVAWQHAFDTPSDTSRLSLSGYDSFSVKGVPVAEDSALVQLGLNLKLTPQASLDLGYSGQFGDGHNDHGVRLGLKLAF